MTTIILIGVAIIILVILVLIFMLVRRHGMVKKIQKDVLAHAIPAQATVLNLERGSFTTGEGFRKPVSLFVETIPSHERLK